MLVARLSVLRATCSRGLLNVSKTNTPIIRSYKEPGRSFKRKTNFSEMGAQAVESTKSLKGKIGPMEVGQIAVGGGAVLGLGALCYYGLGMSNEPGAIDRAVVWPQYVRDRIKDTYMYFGASCVLAGASAVAVFKSPMRHKLFPLFSRHPVMATIGMIAVLTASSQAMMSIPYSPGLGSKHLMWLINCGIIGLCVAPYCALGGAIVMRAGWYTAGIIGGLSTVAVCAPNDKFLKWGGPLGIGLGSIIILTLGSAALPTTTTTLGLSMYSVCLYGGLLLFSCFLLHNTQKIIVKAETHPNKLGVAPYDPINASHGIVIDAVNIFIRIAYILGMGGVKKN